MDKATSQFWKFITPINLFIFFIVVFGRYGRPYLYEKYGMPTEAVVTEMTRDTHGWNRALYEFTSDGNVYHGSVYTDHASVGDTIHIWYFLSCPWFNNCHEEALVR